MKPKKSEPKIIGYGIDKEENERPYPIFSTEDYKGKIYKTAKEAKEGREGNEKAKF